MLLVREKGDREKLLNENSERKMGRKDIFTQSISTANTAVYFSPAAMLTWFASQE